jgi:hypothetical protein
MIQQVGPCHVIEGERYKIKHSPDDVDYYCSGIYTRYDEIRRVEVFDQVRFQGVKRTFDNMHMRKYYYRFVSQKERIQQAMEQRALNKILNRLVNDDFTW